MYRLGLICEGPTDRHILTAILDNYLDDFVPIPIQPPLSQFGGDAGPMGGGWKGIRTWCQQELAGGLESLQNMDAIIIQIDADVAYEVDSSLDQSSKAELHCPPPSIPSNLVRSRVLAWLEVTTLDPTCVLCIPAMGSETWALVALDPDNPMILSCQGSDDSDCIECRQDIKAILHGYDNALVEKKDGKYKNRAVRYKELGSELTKGWHRVVNQCLQAQAFDQAIVSLLKGPM